MEIRQTLTLNESMLDVLAKNYISATGIKTKVVFLNILAALITVLGVLFIIEGSYITGALMTLIGIFFFVFDNFLYKRILQSNLRKINQPNLGTTTTYTLTEDGITIESDKGKSEFNWTACDGVRDIDKYIGVNLVNRTVLLFEKDKLSEEEIRWIEEKGKAEKE